jgi:polyketide biosynthesis enoyl-CoA hydratase PksI
VYFIVLFSALYVWKTKAFKKNIKNFRGNWKMSNNKVLRVTRLDPGIVVLVMEERQHQNMFTAALIQELIEVFSEIDKDETVKVVVIHGYDNYFSCGGTQEELFRIYNGNITFSDLKFYDLLLRCEVPTIAAVQGHAIGGGLAFACYADFIILAQESIYTANFMKYGFTPGLGATYIIPKKIGAIAHEMLFSARTYSGMKLQQQNACVPVVPKNQVIQTAIELARDLAVKPRSSLLLLKAHLTQEIREKMPNIIQQELELHKITFSQPEVALKIKELFGT